uniref:Pept_C1 domain-containing protein n=1 Tax=Haemonchus placei TaxID=6290 RepID=A0A0N4WVU7_HAEPC
LTGKALVDYVKEHQPFFKAEYSPDVIEQRKRTLMKMELLEHPMQKEIVAKAKKLVINEDIPESFDAREKWKDCPSIRYIRDQSNCGSCWAVSAAETMSDRLCIHSNGTRKTMISDTDMLSCCGFACGFGCEGGLAIGAWFYAQDFGVCSGGRYEEEVCAWECMVEAKKVYGLYKDEDIIRMDIMKKGPVQTAFEVFEDFYSYKKGVYVESPNMGIW